MISIQLLLTKQATIACARLPVTRSGAILERMGRRIISVAAGAGLAALALLQFAAPARADEIKLKDGSKINGTIVGFEDNSFKVKTSYGFAVVQKDQVVSITVTDAAKQPEPGSAKKADSEAAKTPESATAKKTEAAAVKKTEPAAAKTSVAAAAPTPAVAKPEKVEHASTPPQPKASELQSGSSADNSVEEYPHTDSPTTSAANSAQAASAASGTANASNTPIS